jgi:hypothetical protein
MTDVFPPDFADLEPYADWAIPGENARYAKRMASSMDELQAFYDGVFPRLEAAGEHLGGIALEDMTEADQRLLWLCASLVTVSFPVEVWRQPKVPDSGASTFDNVLEPAR